jgi:site-specific DNA-methyltransferase (adenine-specific)
MKEIESGSVDMILTDPPYGTTACKWDSIIPLEPMWEQLKRIIKPNGAIVLFGAEPFSSALRMSNIKQYKYDWVYRKPQGVDPLMSRYRPMNDIENVIVFAKKQPTYNEQLEKGEPYKITRDKKGRAVEGMHIGKMEETTTVNYGTRKPKRVLDFKQEKGLHPTQKPVALMEYLIKTYTNEGETVLDFTMGSGTTGVAAKNLNRKFIGIELDPGYFEIAKRRING